MGDCQNYGPFLGPYYNAGPNLGDPKRDHSPHEPLSKLLVSPLIMENQMEKKMENEMETTIYRVM